MTGEHWRAAVTRWGDPIFGLALLLTNRRAAAQALTVDVFCRVLTAPPTSDLEMALYSALSKTRQSRWQPVRQRFLPRPFARIAPADRLLLGLWLLRAVDGPRLAAITGLSPQEIVQRLAATLRRVAPLHESLEAPGTTHVTLEAWLDTQLGFSAQTHDHVLTCSDCQAMQDDWQAAVADLRMTLRRLVQQRLPLPAVDAIETTLFERQAESPEAWWQHRRVWLPALVGGIGLMLVLLIAPWRDAAPPTAAPVTAQQLVQQTIDAWTTMPVTGTLHRQVRALDARNANAPMVVTDLWLVGPDSAQHRVEVRDGATIVEWQIADGEKRLDYAANPDYSACMWRINAATPPNMLDRTAMTFRVPPAQQRAARDTRLLLGAYGEGYVALQRALAAGDLRSFGTRADGETSVVVLGYTDGQITPPQQRVIHIDPMLRQLTLVQAVTSEGGQTQVRDLWRLQLRDESQTPLPLGVPNRSSNTRREHLLDPACLPLEAEFVVSPRTIGAIPWQQWYLPSTLPPGTIRAALITPYPMTTNSNDFPSGTSEGTRAIYVGPGRWLSVSGFEWANSTPMRATPLIRGEWKIFPAVEMPSGEWQGRIHPVEGPYDDDGPGIEVRASGYTEDEVLAVIDTLQLVEQHMWLTLDQTFLDAQPLSAPVRETLARALVAAQPPAGSTLYSATSTQIRGDPQRPQLADPYYRVNMQRFASALTRQQWLVHNESGAVTHFRDIQRLKDDTLFFALVGDTRQLKGYVGVSGQAWSNATSTAIHELPIKQPSLEMITAMLRVTSPITLTTNDTHLQLEQTTSFLVSGADPISYRFGETPSPWTNDLRVGLLVRRLTLDPVTAAPRQLEIVHRDEQGYETHLLHTVIDERRTGAALPTAALLEMPPLPPGVLQYNEHSGNVPTIDGMTLDKPWRGRRLVWPESVASNELQAGTGQSGGGSGAWDSMWQSRWHSFVASTAWHQARYHIRSNDSIVMVTQGPSNVMAHSLNHQQPYSPPESDVLWSHSEPLRVTIDGKERTAWLLQDTSRAALVVEVDEVLLHFVASEEYLKGPLLKLLPNLEWTEPQA